MPGPVTPRRLIVAVSLLAALVTPLASLESASASVPHSVPGVSGGSITIGATLPLSGPSTKLVTASSAAAAVFKYVNTKGGVNGRHINYVRMDDCMNLAAFGLGCGLPISSTTLSQTKALLATGVFATVGSVGTGAQSSVEAYLNTAKIPQLFVDSGSTLWNKPALYPQTFGFSFSFQEEGKIFAAYIKSHFAGQKVGFIGEQDSVGSSAFDTLGSGTYSGLTSKTGLVVAKTDKRSYNVFDALGGANDIVPSIAQLMSDSVKVVVLASTPPVTQAVLTAAHAAGFSPHWIITSTGSDPTDVLSPLENGALTLSSLPATNDAANAWNVWLRKVLAADHTDVPSYKSTAPLDPGWQYGAAYAVAFCEALHAVGRNVTRAAVVTAMRTTAFATPTVLPLRYTSANHQGLQGGVIAKVSGSSLVEGSHVVYTTTSAPASLVSTTVHYSVATIPLWMR
jgi:ABC-type branched-subunit amino acid transport system substrate-binding protein